MHEAFGRLRGHAEPSQEVGDKLLAINPRFRLSWVPDREERPGYWVVSDRRGDPIWRDAGLARMKRYAQVGATKMGPHTYWDTEAIIDGDHTVAIYPDVQMGTDRFFQELRHGEAALKGMLETVERGLKARELADVEGEAEHDPVFAEYLHASAYQAYDQLKRKVIPTHGLKVEAA